MTDLQTIRDALAAATPGPYRLKDGGLHKGEVLVEECGRAIETIAHFYCGAYDGHGRANAELFVLAGAVLAELVERVDAAEDTLEQALADARREHADVVARAEAAEREIERLRGLLRSLLRLTNTIEVLGEWEATDTNRSMRQRERARVDACIEECRAALAAAGREGTT
jgi:hypothetical protein